MNDAEIIDASLAEPSRFAAIFDRHVGAVHRFVARRLGAARADDVTSEVFRIAFERRQQFEPIVASALPWLYGIAANLVRHQHRNHARWLAMLRRAEGRRERSIDPLVDAADRIDADANRARLVDAVLALCADEREILLLVAWEQLTPSEAAAVLGIPAATARTRLHRARARIRRHLEGDGAEREVASDAH